jgi:long-chain fatty acid transport protein
VILGQWQESFLCTEIGADIRKKIFFKKIITVLSVILALYLSGNLTLVHGSGFLIDTQGASSVAQGAATIAHTDCASAIFFNPALLNKLEGTQIEIGTTLFFPSIKFESDTTGKTSKAGTEFDYTGTFFVTHKFNDKISAGIGVFSPFGLETAWPDDWEGRYITTKSELQTFNINPAVSYQITPYLAVSAGFDVLLLDATMEKKINLSGLLGFPVPDGEQKLDGDGTGLGYNLGILLEPHKDVAIGASYRSEIKVDVEGKVNHDIPDSIPLPYREEIQTALPNTKATTDTVLPQQAYMGIYYKGFDPLTFEIAARWEGWASYDSFKIHFDKPVADSTSSVFEKNWKDTYSYNIGVKYQLNESVAFLAGYLYNENPIPDETFEPSIPDANSQQFSIGTDIKFRKLRLAFAYAYQKWQERNKRNAIDDDPIDGILNSETSANGKYRSDVHVICISLNYRF